MKTLYSVLESIADSDEETLHKGINDLVPYKIVDIFLSIFSNMCVDRDPKYDKNNDIAGKLRLTQEDIEDRASTEITLKSNIRKFIKEVKKEFPKAECSSKIRDNSITFIYQKNFSINLSIDSISYALTICLVGSKLHNSANKTHREIDYVRILTGNDGLKDAFHNKVK